MHGLSRSLSARNLKTKLQVVRGPPQTVVPALCSAWHITHLVFDKDNAAYAAVRDAVVKSRGCRGGSGTRYPGPYVAVRYLLAPDRPLPLPKHIPSLGSIDIPKFTRTEHPVHRNVDLNADSCVGSRGDFEIPTLEGAWVTPCNNEHQGRVKETRPAVVDPPATAFGVPGTAASPNATRSEVEKKKYSDHTDPPEHLEGPLEMYYAAERVQGLSFSHIRGHVCRDVHARGLTGTKVHGLEVAGIFTQISSPDTYRSTFRTCMLRLNEKSFHDLLGMPLTRRDGPHGREKKNQKNGRTGFPWIDAICFLTRGPWAMLCTFPGSAERTSLNGEGVRCSVPVPATSKTNSRLGGFIHSAAYRLGSLLAIPEIGRVHYIHAHGTVKCPPAVIALRIY
ncbi:hypothetical protein V8E55_007085 [Tylopilus felleus]